MKTRTAKFQIGQIVKHRIFAFRGVIFDIDPEFNNTEEWWLSIPEPVRHSQIAEIFVKDKSGGYRPRNPSLN